MSRVTENTSHVLVLARAERIYKDRSKVRGNLWARSDAGSQVRMIEEKVQRATYALALADRDGSLPESAKAAAVDDLLDIINFAVFAVRHLEGDLPEATASTGG